jgi:peptide/nickel transport system permease protein
MAAFLARRLLHGFIVVALVATIVFLLIRAAPGDPFSGAMEDPSITEAVREAWRHAYGLDRPIFEQFVSYVRSMFHGELGFSTLLKRPVVYVLRDALPNTLLLMSIGLISGFLLGIEVAIAQVRNLGKKTDKVLGGISITFFSIPDFWLALLILVGLGYWLPGRIFPLGGAIDVVNYDGFGFWARAWDRIAHLILPSLTLALLYFPLFARHQRAALIDTLPSDYMVTARAKGVSERALIRKHALRNAVLPVVTLLGLAFPALLTGAVFVEKVFSWPGMGLRIVESIGNRDYPLLTASVILASAFVVAGSIIADALHLWLDPRLRDDR